MVSQEYLENDNNDINTLSFPNTSLGDGDDGNGDMASLYSIRPERSYRYPKKKKQIHLRIIS
ncbi:1783_t:CDS:1, partial [Funneliformis caledonium]